VKLKHKTQIIMKKITLFFLTFSLIVISSCEKENDSNKPEIETSIDYSEYGKLHNEALGLIFQDLKSEIKINKKMSKGDYFELIASSTNNFVETKYNDKRSIDISKNVISIMKSNFINSKKTSTEDFSLTPYQEKNFQKMNTILEEDGDLKFHQDRLTELKLQIESDNIDSDEKAPILIGISVAQYSLDYWNENIENWIALSDNKYSWSDLGSDLLDMAKYDAGGAVVGAVAGAGVLSAPGAVAGGAYASAGEGVVKLIESF